MPFEVDIMFRAKIDVVETIDWLKRRSPQSAASWRSLLEKQLQTLEDRPQRCALAAEAADLGIEIRELLFGKRRNIYRILFVVQSNRVKVLRIRHSLRDWLTSDDL
jgi:plasmid stabilization system protein ParE